MKKRSISAAIAISGVLLAVWVGVNFDNFIVAKLLGAVMLIAALIVRGRDSSSKKEN
jgi:hypothetical protein